MTRYFAALVAMVWVGVVLPPVLGEEKDEALLAWREKAKQRFGETPKPEEIRLIEEALPAFSAPPQKARRVLVFYRCEGFIHTSIPYANHVFRAWGNESFSADFSDDYRVFDTETLAQYDAIVFNNTTHLNPNESQRAAILAYIQGGRGIVGIHAAADNFGEWDEGVALIGGIFDGHPWTAGGTWAFKVEDVEHRLNAAFRKKGLWLKDEIYWYKPENFQGRERLRVLLSLDMSQPKNAEPLADERWKKHLEGKNIEELDVPVSWIREMGSGRLFFTNLGHNDMTFADPVVLQHLADGLQYAMGDLEADATPSAKVKVEVAPAPEPAPAP